MFSLGVLDFPIQNTVAFYHLALSSSDYCTTSFQPWASGNRFTGPRDFESDDNVLADIINDNGLGATLFVYFLPIRSAEKIMMIADRDGVRQVLEKPQ